jgi:hypothetical protein
MHRQTMFQRHLLDVIVAQFQRATQSLDPNWSTAIARVLPVDTWKSCMGSGCGELSRVRIWGNGQVRRPMSAAKLSCLG